MSMVAPSARVTARVRLRLFASEEMLDDDVDDDEVAGCCYHVGQTAISLAFEPF
jgi:hypothetical protein